MTPFAKFKARIRKRRFYHIIRFITCKQAYVFARHGFPSQAALDFALWKSIKNMEKQLKKREGI